MLREKVEIYAGGWQQCKIRQWQKTNFIRGRESGMKYIKIVVLFTWWDCIITFLFFIYLYSIYIYIYIFFFFFFKEHTFFIMGGKIEPLMLKEFSQLQKMPMLRNCLWETPRLKEADWGVPGRRRKKKMRLECGYC